jgi:glucuronate isomerase
MPIFDYHSHLPAAQVLDDVNFGNITQVWLYGDHYKWRAMRACGIPEELASGVSLEAGENAPPAPSDYQRFEAWAKAVPQTVGNPLFHWSHLELKRYFGVDGLLNPESAKKIYDHCSALLRTPEFSARSIIRRSGVKVICTTDDPTDDLKSHAALAKENWGCKVYPAWRPDKVLGADKIPGLNAWIGKLETVSGKTVSTYDDLLGALQARHDFFHSHGCRLSDYGIERPYAAPYTASEVESAFKKIRGGGPSLADDELERYRSAILRDLLRMDARAGWTQQLHLGARRDNNTKAFKALGPDAGYDSIGQFDTGRALVELLDRLNSENALARTILYSLDPNGHDMLASIAGSFMDGKTPGKIQVGSAWWYNDHKDGMNRQLSALASIGLISRFVGMLTDSRSFLSYPRHEYFRRLLCAKFGADMENGELPPDFGHIGGVVRDICYNNAADYFQLAPPE